MRFVFAALLLVAACKSGENPTVPGQNVAVERPDDNQGGLRNNKQYGFSIEHNCRVYKKGKSVTAVFSYRHKGVDRDGATLDRPYYLQVHCGSDGCSGYQMGLGWLDKQEPMGRWPNDISPLKVYWSSKEDVRETISNVRRTHLEAIDTKWVAQAKTEALSMLVEFERLLSLEVANSAAIIEWLGTYFVIDSENSQILAMGVSEGVVATGRAGCEGVYAAGYDMTPSELAESKAAIAKTREALFRDFERHGEEACQCKTKKCVDAALKERANDQDKMGDGIQGKVLDRWDEVAVKSNRCLRQKGFL